MQSWGLSPVQVVIAIVLFYIALGCLMDELSVLLLTIPIFFPVIIGLDFGMPKESVAIWFGILVLMTVSFGLLSPPVGLNVFVVNGMARNVPLSETFRGVLPFLASDAVRLALLIAFPPISLWLVRYHRLMRENRVDRGDPTPLPLRQSTEPGGFQMKRRTLIQGAAAAAVAGPQLSGFAQQSVTLKFHTFMAPLSNVWLTMHKPWMEKVEKDSGGRIKFEAYPAMQLGGTPGAAVRPGARRRGRHRVDAAGQYRRALSAHRGVRAAVRDEQRRGDVQGVLGIRADPRARRVQGDAGHRAARARAGHVPFGDQADQDARPT